MASARKRSVLVASVLALAALVAGVRLLRPRARAPEANLGELTSVWSREKTPTKSPLRAVTGPSAEPGIPALAVGDDGVVLMRAPDGAWERAETPTKARLNAVANHHHDSIAVGESGTIVRYDRQRRAWKLDPSGTTEHLYAVATPRFNSAIAVGARGTILELAGTETGGACRRVPVDTTVDLFAARVVNDQFVVVGDEGTVLVASKLDGRFNALTFVAQKTPTKKKLHTIGTPAEGLMVGGADGALMTAVEDRPWALTPTPITGDVRAIARALFHRVIPLPSGREPAGKPFRAMVFASVIAADDRLYVRAEAMPSFAELSTPAPPKGITGLVETEAGLLAVTSSGEIWRLADAK